MRRRPKKGTICDCVVGFDKVETRLIMKSLSRWFVICRGQLVSALDD